MRYRDATALLDNKKALRRKFDTDGCAYFAGLIPRDEVLALRRIFLEQLDKWGWLAPDTGLMDGIIDLSIDEAEGSWQQRYYSAYPDLFRLQEFHRLAHHPAIISLFEKLFGEAVLVHPRNIVRPMVPHKDSAPTPPHQDYIHVQGTEATYTCWFPLGDCPISLGGISVLPGSHKMGLLPIRAAKGAGGRGSVFEQGDREWA